MTFWLISQAHRCKDLPLDAVHAGRSACWNVSDQTSCHLNKSNNLEAWNKQFDLQVGHSPQTIWNNVHGAIVIRQ